MKNEKAPSPLPLWGSASIPLNEEATAIWHSPKGERGGGSHFNVSPFFLCTLSANEGMFFRLFVNLQCKNP